MTTVARLVTFVDIDEDAASRTQMGVSARLEAELSDGGRIVLLDDRGWASSVSHTSEAMPDVWTHTSLEEIRETARTVVGPDEPFGDQSQEDMATDHWASLQKVLERHRMPHGRACLKQDGVVESPVMTQTRGRQTACDGWGTSSWPSTTGYAKICGR